MAPSEEGVQLGKEVPEQPAAPPYPGGSWRGARRRAEAGQPGRWLWTLLPGSCFRGQAWPWRA